MRLTVETGKIDNKLGFVERGLPKPPLACSSSRPALSSAFLELGMCEESKDWLGWWRLPAAWAAPTA